LLGAALIVGSVAVVITAQQLAPKSNRPVATAAEAADCAT